MNPSQPGVGVGVGGPTTAATPGSHSQASGSHGTAASESGSAEKDPFLSLLEQLAENEQNSQGGPSELDFFLGASGVGGVDAATGGDGAEMGQGMINNNNAGEDEGANEATAAGNGGAGDGNDEMSGVIQ